MSLDLKIDPADDFSSLMWGTYGKGGNQPLKWVRLIDCSREHLEAILRTQWHIKGTIYERAIRTLLEC